MIDEYARLKKTLWNPIFRRQKLINLVNERPWYEGFDGLLTRLSYEDLFSETTVGFKYFRHDVREFFPKQQDFKNTRKEAKKMDANSTGDPGAGKLEALIYRMVGAYISRKLRSKYDLEWEQVKAIPAKKKEYEDMKEKIAKDAFLAVRSRTGMDFANYFASTICSVSQHINEEDFVEFARELNLETDKVRTLTMLALSARS